MRELWGYTWAHPGLYHPIQHITGNPFTLPDGRVVRYSPGTISKWVAQYQNGGIEALMPRERADKGGTRVLPDTAIEEIHRLKQAFPRLNATQVYRQLVEEGFIPATVSVCAVQRYIKHNDLKSARNPTMRDRKAFEEDAFGKLWQAWRKILCKRKSTKSKMALGKQCKGGLKPFLTTRPGRRDGMRAAGGVNAALAAGTR